MFSCLCLLVLCDFSVHVFTWLLKRGCIYHCALSFCNHLIIDSLLPYLFELSSHKDAVEFEMQSVTSLPIQLSLSAILSKVG